MAEFIRMEPVVVEPEETIKLPEIRMDYGSKWWICCKWVSDGIEEIGSWEIKNESLEGAYFLWREEQWKKLFDPFKVKILGLEIVKME